MVLAVGVLIAASLIGSMATGNDSPLDLIVGIALLVLVVQTMRRAWTHLHR